MTRCNCQETWIVLKSRHWRACWQVLVRVAIVLGWIGSTAAIVQAQAEIRNFGQPLLVVNSGGHTAPLRALAFTPDGQTLLSAGQDKLIHAWDLRDGRSRIVQTIRPPIWNGPRGAIYAIALSPNADEQGQRLLAVAGVGVDSTGGSILLYRFPGSEGAETGDLLALLPGGDIAQAAEERSGHTDVVHALAFSPDGRFLASASSDATLRVWDLNAENRPTVATLIGHEGPVLTLAFAPDGNRIFSGGRDGVVRLWDWRAARLLASAGPDPEQVNPADPSGVQINTLAITPDGRLVVVGRENGLLQSLDATTLGGLRYLQTVEERQRNLRGAVEALAISPDGSRLATSVLKYPPSRTVAPRVECEILLRRLPDGQPEPGILTTSNLALAMAFRPDGRRLAFGGSNAQAVHLKDLQDPAAPLEILRGQGWAVWDVGFGPESTTIGFSKIRPLQAVEPRPYEGFDFKTRAFVDVEPARLQRAIETFEGWQVRPVNLYTLDVVNAQGRGFRVELDPIREGRWWAYSFLPGLAEAGHPRLTFAVATEGGVGIYRIPDGQKTRHLSGHNGAVYTLAPSPNGLWLATGSSDQTVRLWSLAACDTRPTLGATFGPAPEGEEGRSVVEVLPGSFAEAMGLQPGDHIQRFHILDNTPIDPETFLKQVDTVEPGRLTFFYVQREGELFPIGTRRVNPPALSLFPSEDREWVVWMPQGYYDTSITGDQRFLGWHVNRLANVRDATTIQASDYFPLSRYEASLRRPAALDTLLETGDSQRALAVVREAEGLPERPEEALAVVVPPPDVQIVTPDRPEGAAVEVAELSVSILARAAEGRRLQTLEWLNDTERLGRIDLQAPLPEEVSRVETIRLHPGENWISVRAVDDQNIARLVRLRVIRRITEPEPEPERAAKLVVRAIGVEDFPAEAIPQIKFAQRDAQGLADFLVEPGGRRHFENDATDVLILNSQEAGAEAIAQVFEDLQADFAAGKLLPGDSVFVAIVSHVLDFEGPNDLLLGADTQPGDPPAPSVSTEQITECLGQLASYGCTVLLLLDAVHEPSSPAWPSRVKEWVRELYLRRDVIVLVASNQGPGQRLDTYERGAFAEAMLQSLEVRGRSRPLVRPEEPITLDDLFATVETRVQELTSRSQFPIGCIPETISDQISILQPQRLRSDVSKNKMK